MMMMVEVAHPRRCSLSTPLSFSPARRRASSSGDSLAPRTVRNYCRSSIWPPKLRLRSSARSLPPRPRPVQAAAAAGVPSPPLDLTEENIRLVLADARVEASNPVGSNFRHFGRHDRTSRARRPGWTLCEDKSQRPVLA
ncbi:uncharacterized protein LOC115664045 isoform X2 [Syzygium oleosum]|uniref:uncharacterized protein LOC115664045 isoform X2 n=1 Tax=Syzygium oleosum TaxID=219896 RepID=UPI0024BBB3FF|nr:uncharacterized protein LOC115664045 isoform X2 [Syzygium oleosum]